MLKTNNFFTVDANDVSKLNDDDVFLVSTHHNSFLSLDAASGLLTHTKIGSPNTSFLCVCAKTDPDAAIFRRLSGGAARIENSAYRIADLGALELPDRQGQMVFLVDGQYLSSNMRDGSNEMRSSVNDWEIYQLVPLSSIAKVAAWNGRWLHHATRTLLDFQRPERLLDFRTLNRTDKMGGLVDFNDWPPTSEHAAIKQGPDAAVSSFNPLVYYCVYGSYEYLETLALSLESLDYYGRFDGTVGIITSFTEAAVRKHVPERFQKSLRIFPMPHGSPWLGRYCLDDAALEQFQPILYLDCDVVCAGPIDDLLIDILMSEKVCIATEWAEYAGMPSIPSEWGGYGNWFGKFLFDTNIVPYSGEVAFGNSGIIGMRNARICKDAFSCVVELVRQPGAILTLGDQPFLNFLLHALGAGDFTLMDKHVQIVRSSSGVSVQNPHTLVHVLNALTKTDKTSELRLTIAHVLLQKNFV